MKRQSIFLVFAVTFLVLISLAACTARPGIQGTIKDKDNQPLANVKIFLKQLDASDSTAEQSGYTDANGFFLFENQRSGQYLLNVLWDANPSCPDFDTSLPLKRIDDFLVTYASNPSGHVIIATSKFDYNEGDRQTLNLQLPCSGQASGPAVSSDSLEEGDLVTELELSTYDDQSYSLSDFQDKVLVINFCNSWAIPCSQLALILEQVSQKYQTQNVVFFGVNYQDTQSNALAFITESGITYAFGPDSDNKLSSKFGVEGVPETVVIDQSGRIAKILHGTEGVTVESLSEIIEDLIK